MGLGTAHKGRGCFSARHKTEAVLQLPRGDNLEILPREPGVTAPTLAAWREPFPAAGEASLKTRQPRQGCREGGAAVAAAVRCGTVTRSRPQVYRFRCAKAEDLRNPRDLKLKVISHFENPMPPPAVDARESIDLCQSGFERNVFQRLAKLGYRVPPQVAVGEYRIDLVVEGGEDRRPAIELTR